MQRVLTATRLHFNKWSAAVVLPLTIVGLVWLITLLIQITILRVTGAAPNDPSYIDGARMNMAFIWAMPGFLVYYGVQAVATTYPFGLALGFTRRDFIAGTAIANLATSLYVTVLMLAMLGLELATGHWFVGAYVLDVTILGSGNPWILAASAFLGVFFCLTAGGLFGAVWVRFGAKGPAVLGLSLGLALAVALLLLAPQLIDIVTSITRGSLAVSAGIAIVVSLVATWFAMRRASVR